MVLFLACLFVSFSLIYIFCCAHSPKNWHYHFMIVLLQILLHSCVTKAIWRCPDITICCHWCSWLIVASLISLIAICLTVVNTATEARHNPIHTLVNAQQGIPPPIFETTTEHIHCKIPLLVWLCSKKINLMYVF